MPWNFRSLRGFPRFGHSFLQSGIGMTPSSLVLRRHREEADAAPVAAAAPDDSRVRWRDAFRVVRAETERRAAPLTAEDQVVQSMADASPTKWHRAHTTWFLEQFLLRPCLPGYRVFDERFAYLFNSYYVAAGPRHARPQRGLITRPDCDDVTAFRSHVDEAVERLLATASEFGSRGGDPHPRDRPASRTAASRASAHRHPARVRAESGSSRLRPRLARAAAILLGWICAIAARYPSDRFCRARLLLRQ